jgi:hypothetical protein
VYRRVATARVHHASHHAALRQPIAAAQLRPASARTLASVTPASGKAGPAERRLAKASPTLHGTHGLAKGHDKQAQRQKATKSIQPVGSPSGAKQQGQSNVGAQQPDGGQGNGHSHG